MRVRTGMFWCCLSIFACAPCSAESASGLPPEQSDIMAKALRASSKPVTLLKLPGDDHWLSNAATRVQALTEVDNFLRSDLSN